MTERGRLIELLYNIPPMNINGGGRQIGERLMTMQHIADYLLANGVIVPPCKVGDMVYKIWRCGNHGKSVAEFVVTHIDVDNYPSIEVVYRKPYSKSTYCHYFAKASDFGKTVFLTKEEAEKALADWEK